ncbi:MAG TPA: hypothetical protein V6D26_25300 [Stenomitos sp.]
MSVRIRKPTKGLPDKPVYENNGWSQGVNYLFTPKMTAVVHGTAED